MENFTDLSYNEIRSKCKSFGLKANGKKVDLITKLTTYLRNLAIGSDSQNNIEETEGPEAYQNFVTDDEDEGDEEKIIEQAVEGGKINCKSSDDALKEVNSTNIDKDDKKNITLSEDATKDENSQVNKPTKTAVNFLTSDEEEPQKDDKLKAMTKKEGRFNRQHRNIFKKAESIVERHERIKELHAKHEASVPDTFKRLATPKRVSSIGRLNNFPSESRNGFDFSKAPMDTSTLSCVLNRTPAKNFDSPKVGGEIFGSKKFLEKKKELSLRQKLSCSYKKASSNFTNINTTNKTKPNDSKKVLKGPPTLTINKESQDKSRKCATIRSNAASKRERRLNVGRK